jgi:rifampicin phosphotransferase
VTAQQATPARPDTPNIFFFARGIQENSTVGKEVLGGKGHSLAEMSRAELAVPPGFTISTDCCRAYREMGRKWPAGLEEEIRRALSWLEECTGRRLGAGPRPLLVSVRSGAAVSMPGMMDTILNVGLHPGLAEFYPDKEGFWTAYRDFAKLYGETACGIDASVFANASEDSDPAARGRAETRIAAFKAAAGREFPTDPWAMLVEAITAVFDSWNSERAVRYRERNNIRGLSGTAVNVQAMFPSEHSGILFTTDPTDPQAGRIVIEAGTGLGEAIVSGAVEPDVYVVDRNKMEIIEKRISDKDVSVRALSDSGSSAVFAEGGACLSDQQIRDLVDLGLRVEKHFGFPVDLEWGWAEGRFGLLQSRKIRGLEIALDVEPARQAEIARIRKQSEGRGKVEWAIYNLAETLKSPTPMTWDIMHNFMSGSGGFINMYRDLGYFPSERVNREGILALIGGRIYADLELHAELFFDQWPQEYDSEGADDATSMLEGPPTKFNFERAGGSFLLRLPLYIFKMIRQGRRLRKMARTCLDKFENQVKPSFLAYVKAARAKNLAEMDERQLLAELDEREKAFNQIARESEKTSFIAGYHQGRLTAVLGDIMGPEAGQTFATRLIVGLQGDKTVDQNIDLYRVSQGELSLEKFLEEYGHRCTGEFELAEPRWYEDSVYLQQQVESYKKAHGKDPIETHHKQQAERKKAEEELTAKLEEHGATSLEDDIRADLAGAQKYLPYRETSKYYYMMAYALIRDALEELAERWDLGRDLYFLRRGELAECAQQASRREALVAEIAKRKTRWQALQRLDMPDFISSDDPEAVGRPVEYTGAEDGVFAGKGVAAGSQTGVARIVHSPKEAGDLGPNYVLVCTSTDPGWTPLFVHARGVIVERGGMLSHGAIVARDFGIPCVVLAGATKLIPNGAEIKIDGNRGTIELVGASAAKEG